jgi:predicted transcriptional regulator
VDNLQLLLTGDKAFSDINVCFSASDNSISLQLGLSLIEKLRWDPDSLQYKMMIGRLANLGYPLRRIMEEFGHDHRTIRRWAKGLTTLNADELRRIYSGQGALSKVDDAVDCFVRSRYRDLCRTVRDYRERIRKEVQATFNVCLSGEILRQIFRREDADAFPVSPIPAGGEPVDKFLPVSVSESPAPVIVSPPPDSPSSTPVFSPPDAGGDLPVLLENGCASSPFSGSNLSGSRNHSTTPGLLPLSGGLPHGGPVFRHHAGAIIFSVWMDRVDRGRPEAWAVQRQWLGQILQGAVNIEQSKCIFGADLSCFTGATGLDIKTQRGRLFAAIADETMAEWLYDANRRIVPDGPGLDQCFYYDPHTKECMTELPFLKGWCGRIHGTAKVLHMDCIHTRRGYPVYVRHYDNFYDLRERAVMTLNGFDKLFPEQARHDRVLVVDRGIFSREIFAVFRENGWGLVTWEKGYSGAGWQEGSAFAECMITRYRNDTRHPRLYRFQVQETPWEKKPGVRRLVVKATNPEGKTVELGVLCSSPTLAATEAVIWIFSRWVQENGFKTLDEHFGFMAITSYRSETYHEIATTLQDRPVESIEFRELKSRIRKLHGLQEKELYERERIQDILNKDDAKSGTWKEELRQGKEKLDAGIVKIDGGDKSNSRFIAQLDKLADQCMKLARRLFKHRNRRERLLARLESLQASIASRKEEIAKLETQMETVVRADSRLRLLLEMGAVRPDTRAKAIMDAHKVTAHNIFACLLAEFRKFYDNRRDDAVILRLLTRSPGCLRMNSGTLEVALWPQMDLPPATRKTVGHFLDEISRQINQHFHGQFVEVRVRLLGSFPHLGQASPTGKNVVIQLASAPRSKS